MELFFKWIKQHLRIKRFFGTSEHAVKSQIWIAVSVYVPRRPRQEAPQSGRSRDTVLQIFSRTLFETRPIQHVFAGSADQSEQSHDGNQLNLFTF